LANSDLKAAYEAEKKTLQRENVMITAAWYDLTNRLQSNHVVVQRRQDSQKSWLKKQRQMVVGSPRQ
jgi:protein HOOK3